MVGWHHRLNGHGFGWTPGVGDGQGGLVCCGSWGRKESDTTERLNWTLIIPIPQFKTKVKAPPLTLRAMWVQLPIYNKTEKCYQYSSSPYLIFSCIHINLCGCAKLALMKVTNDFHIAKYNDQFSVFLLLYLRPAAKTNNFFLKIHGSKTPHSHLLSFADSSFLYPLNIEMF